MALLSPNQIHNVMKEAILAQRDAPESLSDLLESANIGKRETLNTIGDIMRGADTSATRLGAAKLAAQLNGMIDKDSGIQMPTVNIIIRDSEFSFNPILIPR
jgi:hypothetical protein